VRLPREASGHGALLALPPSFVWVCLALVPPQVRRVPHTTTHPPLPPPLPSFTVGTWVHPLLPQSNQGSRGSVRLVHFPRPGRLRALPVAMPGEWRREERGREHARTLGLIGLCPSLCILLFPPIFSSMVCVCMSQLLEGRASRPVLHTFGFAPLSPPPPPFPPLPPSLPPSLPLPPSLLQKPLFTTEPFTGYDGILYTNISQPPTYPSLPPSLSAWPSSKAGRRVWPSWSNSRATTTVCA